MQKDYNENLDIDKEIVLSLYNISKIRKEDIENKSLKNKFLIFMDRIEKGQTVFETHMKYINKYYQKSEYFYKFKNVGESDKSTKTSNDDNCLTYTIVNGGTDNSINDFCNDDVPDILIVISSTASQGVNLPGYSYIINFDVSASIANLEQRFGRIDRLNDTRFRNIHFVYMLGYRDKNYSNFIEAVWEFNKSIEDEEKITLPSKNVLICKETICSLGISYSENSDSLENLKTNIKENKIIDSVYIEKFKDNSKLVELIKNYNDKLTKDENSKKEITAFIDQCIKTSELVEKIYGINENKNDDILDSIFYKNGGKICMISGIECADHILEKRRML